MAESQSTATTTTSPTKSVDPRTLAILVFFALAAVIGIGAGVYLVQHNANGDWGAVYTAAREGFSSSGFWTAAGVGLLAQVVDGALGMAYGVTSTTFLLSTGVPPAAASASVHIAEVFTTAFSGASHWRLGNVNVGLFKRLVIPGVIGGVVGAYLLTNIDANIIKPIITAYLLLMGVYILIKAFKTIRVRTEPPTLVAPLALTGGFVDAVGGGGWGPVVTTSLVGSGQDPRTTIGSVNAAEFFIAVSTGLSFAVLGGLVHWTTIAGLVIGGLFAAPIAAFVTSKLNARTLMIIVGLLISGLSIYNLVKYFKLI